MSLGPRSRLRKENVDGVIVVSFTDTKIVAEDQIQEVGDELYALVEDSTKKKILLNFGNVQYCSSTVLGKLVSLKRRVDAAKGKLKLCCIHPDLLVPFKLTGLDKVFEIHAEEQAALNKYWAATVSSSPPRVAFARTSFLLGGPLIPWHFLVSVVVV
jgi:anti-sigma B factor antagonist